MVEPVFGGSKETWGGLLCRLKSLIRVSRDQLFSFWCREDDTLSNGNVSWKRKVQFRCSVMSNSLWPCGLQHTRLPCPTLSPEVYSDSCPLSQWCYLAVSSFVTPLLLLPSIIPSIRVFSNESTLCIKWPKYWNFSFSNSSSNECSGLIRMDWFDLLAVQGTLKSLLQHHSTKYQFFGAKPSLWSNSHIHT